MVTICCCEVKGKVRSEGELKLREVHSGQEAGGLAPRSRKPRDLGHPRTEESTFLGVSGRSGSGCGTIAPMLPSSFSRRHAPDRRVMLVNGRSWLRGVSERRVLSGPRVIPGRIDFLLAIGGAQQGCNHRAKQHCNQCQDSAGLATSGSVPCTLLWWIDFDSTVIGRNHGWHLAPAGRQRPWRGSEAL
jgi:hypothetical protein